MSEVPLYLTTPDTPGAGGAAQDKPVAGVAAAAAERFRGGLVFKAHRLVYHSNLGLREIKKKKKLLCRMSQTMLLLCSNLPCRN